MIRITVVFGEGPVSAWQFVFKETATADAVYEAAKTSMSMKTILEFTDDIGQRPLIAGWQISALNYEDQENPAMKEMIAAQRRAQMSGQQFQPGPMPRLMS